MVKLRDFTVVDGLCQAKQVQSETKLDQHFLLRSNIKPPSRKKYL
jgi:hypothetical protein